MQLLIVMRVYVLQLLPLLGGAKIDMQYVHSLILMDQSEFSLSCICSYLSLSNIILLKCIISFIGAYHNPKDYLNLSQL